MLTDLATDTPEGVTDWPGALDNAGLQRDTYQPLAYAPSGDPETAFDDPETRYRIRYGHP